MELTLRIPKLRKLKFLSVIFIDKKILQRKMFMSLTLRIPKLRKLKMS